MTTTLNLLDILSLKRKPVHWLRDPAKPWSNPCREPIPVALCMPDSKEPACEVDGIDMALRILDMS